MLNRLIIFVFLFVISISFTYSQDSLLNVADNSVMYEERINACNQITYNLVYSDPDKAKKYNDLALKLAKENNNSFLWAQASLRKAEILSINGQYEEALSLLKECLIMFLDGDHELDTQLALNQIGTVYDDMGMYDEAISYYQRSIDRRIKTKDTLGLAKLYKNIGITYKKKGDYVKAIEYYNLSFESFKSLNDISRMGKVMYSIANAYREQNMLEVALDHYDRSIEIMKENNDLKYIAYNNLGKGSILRIQKNYTEAIECFQSSYDTLDSLGYRKAASAAVNNLANVYEDLNKLELAEFYNLEAVRIRTELNDIEGLISSYINLGTVYSKKEDFENGLYYSRMADSLSQKSNFLFGLMTAKMHQAECLANMGDYQAAYDSLDNSINIKDSIFNSENTSKLAEMEAKYNAEKRIQKIKLLEEKAEADKYKRWFNYGLLGVGLVFLGGVAFYFYMNMTRKSRINKSLNDKNKEIVSQKEIIEGKNEDILASIRYAQNIQEAILPDHDKKQLLNSHFIYYQPRDIVSGDFYWIEKVDEAIYLAVVDCTGHGVPGAFMSIVGHQGLNDAIAKGINETGDILNFLNERVVQTLKQRKDANVVNDGMDMFLVKISDGKIEYSGAINEGLIVRNKELIKLKGERKSIGGMLDGNFEGFKTYEFGLEKGDSLFLFSDGIYDQFGGQNKKKMKRRRFNEMLLEASSKLPVDQYKLIDKRIQEWKGEEEQVDDMCLIGLKL